MNKHLTESEQEKDYEPYGKEWKKELMKFTKKQLIDFIRKIKKGRL